MRMRITGTLLGLMICVLLVTGCGSSVTEKLQFDITGTVSNTGGTVPIGLIVTALDTNGLIAGAGGSVQPNGSFTIFNVPEGTYTLFIQQTLNGVTVNTYSTIVSVLNSDVTLAPIIVPAAADLATLGTPDAAAMAVFARDANQLLMAATVQISGVSGSFGPSAPVLVRNLPIGLRNVAITAGGQNFTRSSVAFNLHVITVLCISTAQASGKYTVSGTAINTLGVVLPGIPVSLYRDDAPMAIQTTSSTGSVIFSGLSADTYTLRTTQTVNGVPVDVIGSTLTVVNANVTAPILNVPVAAHIGSLGTPTTCALAVIARNSNNQPVTALVGVDGMANIFGPGSIVTVPNVPVGTRIVTVTSGLQTVTTSTHFSTGRITAVNVVF